MRLSSYVVQKSSNTICKICGQHVHMLAPRSGKLRKPWFYICWLCKNITQVGVGPVQEEA